MSLQIPSPSRPVSAAVSPTSQHGRRQPPQHRASHQVVSSSNAEETQPAFTDVYAHPAAMAFAAAHPRRTIPKFGPYLLLQTLGEGEFGKVKLGLHCQWGEEVAVKLIRRGNVDTAVRMSKVEREIEVLRTLKHPNIVRLYDVIETDKYIGIIIEYASGGELFDHILAHRYLRERDASKLFSQLISGVWYIHQKKIVHRDLKLENLLLDRHRNVIITDFGFANRFEHRADDLMQTSCGSPCYAAPELVISEGLYVGSAVDIWSCGVILYAMLAGYLPFDDDPANPDGDNINLLYKYIVSTPLSFPEYVSEAARDLLGMMLVPDPRRRAGLEEVMRHPWLAAWHVPRSPDADPAAPSAFGKTVEELERAAMEQHQMKRLAYQRQMRATDVCVAGAPAASGVVRSQSQTQSAGQAQNATVARPEFLLYESGSGGATTTTATTTTPGYGGEEDDPFGPVPSAGRRAEEVVALVDGQSPRKDKGKEKAQDKDAQKEKEKEKEDKFRHTIQIEYDGQRGQRARAANAAAAGSPDAKGQTPVRTGRERSRTPTRTGSASTPAQPSTPAAAVNGAGAKDEQQEQVTPSASAKPSSPSSISERKERRRRGSASSVGSPATTKPLPPSPTSPPTTWKRMHEPAKSVVGPGEMVRVNGAGGVEVRPAVAGEKGEKGGMDTEKGEKDGEKKDAEKGMDSRDGEPEKVEKDGKGDGKKSRRNTLTGLTVMTNPISSLRNNIGRRREPSTTTSTSPPTQLGVPAVPAVPAAPRTGGADKSFDAETPSGGAGMKASTSKARKVMQWIRKGRDSLTVAGPSAPGSVSSQAESTAESGDADATSPVQVFVTTPTSGAPLSPIVTKTLAGGRKPSDAAAAPPSAVSATTSGASATPSFASRFRRSINVGGVQSSGSVNSKSAAAVVPAPTAAAGQWPSVRIHHGAVDQGTITTGQPPEVMRHVKAVLVGMGVEIFVESEYKYRCIRAKQRRGGKGTIGGGSASTPPGGVAAFTMVGSAGSNGVDKRGLPLPSQSSFSGGGMLRGLLMRRQSSQVSNAAGSTSFDADESLNNSGILTAEPASTAETVYGAALEDAGDEVRFSVELTRLDRLNDTYSLDIRRLKGNLRSYKFLYDTLRKRADLQR
ncbi:CAMK/CAMKL/Kin4 protein kinase [Mycena polygramma]|nr:CAMK/CAMKL/Kin4 protein kinase [Mycena polygramma]